VSDSENFKSPFLANRERIFENSSGFVIFDKFPVSEGHCLIVPHRVYSNYFDSTEEEIIGLNYLLFKTKDFLEEKFKPSGFNIGINCGRASGQTVDHLHIHIIPRYPNDVDDPKGGVRGVIPDKQKY
jgi:diadenosine tetraphosphate (Ap4A) HIT family hydrolase